MVPHKVPASGYPIGLIIDFSIPIPHAVRAHLSWMERYERYQKEIKECEKINDVSERANALLRAEESFNLWMDIYPESEPWPTKLEAQKKHDQFMDYLGLNPKNPE